MKHLFFVHSQITLIVALKTIRFLNIDRENCTFLIYRIERKDCTASGFRAVELEAYFEEPFPVYNKFWKGRKKIKELDSFINNTTENDKFVFYTPQIHQFYLALIASHAKCLGYNIIEEGFGSYASKEVLQQAFPNQNYDFAYRIKWYLNFLGRVKLNRTFFGYRYENAYGLTSFTFPFLKRKVALGLPTDKDYQSFGSYDDEGVYTNILVFDSLVEAGILPPEIILSATKKLLEFLMQKGERSVYVKYHPDQVRFNDSILSLKALFLQTEGIRIYEIPSHVSLESVASKKAATFYVFVSSVGLYAALYGCKVYSLSSVLADLYPPFTKRVEGLPSIFKTGVTFLSNHEFVKASCSSFNENQRSLSTS